MNTLLTTLRISVTLILLFTVLLGGVYPALVLGVSQVVFPTAANGSMIMNKDKAVGSALLGQEFTKAKYFWGRPSAAKYHAAASAGSNYSPGNPALLAAVKARIAALQKEGGYKTAIPADLVTASGSGLDPHISLAAAEYQIARVARTRGLRESAVRTLVEQHTQHWLGISYVNVLKLNMALDQSSVARVQSSEN